jgi:hypothetical protein
MAIHPAVEFTECSTTRAARRDATEMYQRHILAATASRFCVAMGARPRVSEEAGVALAEERCTELCSTSRSTRRARPGSISFEDRRVPDVHTTLAIETPHASEDGSMAPTGEDFETNAAIRVG